MIPVVMAAFAAASLAVNLMNNKSQGKIEKANASMEASQAQLQASEAALARVKSFREATAMNLAMQGMGVGSTTGFAASQNESLSNVEADIAALQRGAKFAGITGKTKKMASDINRRSNDIGATINSVKLASDLGLFKKGTYA